MEINDVKEPGPPTSQAVKSGSPAVNPGSGSLSTQVTGLEAVKSATGSLIKQIVYQDGGVKLLFQKSDALEKASKKTHSPIVSGAITELFKVVQGLRVNRENLNKAFNAMASLVQKMPSTASTTKLSSVRTQTLEEEAKQDQEKKVATDRESLPDRSHSELTAAVHILRDMITHQNETISGLVKQTSVFQVQQ